MDYAKIDELLQGRCKARRKLANNTYAERRNGAAIAVRLHDTDVLTFEPDGITVKTDGWKTLTTKDRINGYLPGGIRVYSDGGIWYWYRNGEKVAPFSDGDRVSYDGALSAQLKMDAAVAEKKRRKAVRAYAATCAAAVPLDPPGAGDCWYCHMVTADGGTLGDAFKDIDHLESHLAESYIVPSLVYHALKERKAGDLIMAAAFGQADGFADMARGHVKRAVTSYLYRRFSLAT